MRDLQAQQRQRSDVNRRENGVSKGRKETEGRRDNAETMREQRGLELEMNVKLRYEKGILQSKNKNGKTNKNMYKKIKKPRTPETIATIY